MLLVKWLNYLPRLGVPLKFIKRPCEYENKKVLYTVEGKIEKNKNKKKREKRRRERKKKREKNKRNLEQVAIFNE